MHVRSVPGVRTCTIEHVIGRYAVLESVPENFKLEALESAGSTRTPGRSKGFSFKQGELNLLRDIVI